MTNDDSYFAKLAELQQQYANRMTDDFEQIIHLFQKLEGTESDRAFLDELQSQLHRLAGSAGTFGFKAVGECAKVLESEIIRLLKTGLGQESRQTIAELLEKAQKLEGLVTTFLERDHQSVDQAGPNGLLSQQESDLMLWLVGPEAAHIEAIKNQLKSFTYQVEHVKGPDELPKKTPPQSNNLIILDLDSSNLDLSMVPHVTARFKDVIGISRRDDFHIRKATVQAGIPYFLPKHADTTLLFNTVDRIAKYYSAPPERVMLIEDDADVASLYETYLKNAGMEVCQMHNPEHCLEGIEEFRPELILMDLHMPTISGSELAGIIRQQAELETLPIVFLSGEINFSSQMAAMSLAKADDFLTKPIASDVLVGSVRSRIKRFRQLSELMIKDSLTGLMTHARIKDAIDMEVGRSKRRGTSTAVAMLDLDNFKSINDRLGHAAGDKVIKAMSLLLRQALRYSDMKGRYGGEEFLVLMPDSDREQAVRLMENIRTRFETLDIQHEGQTVQCTVSIGVAGSLDFPHDRGEALIDHADKALYAAKKAGKNQTQVATKASKP